MKHKTMKIWLPLTLAFMIGAVSAAPLSAGAAADDYYAPVTAAAGTELLGQLHDLITTTHSHYSTYGECRDYAHTTDFAEGSEESVIEFYTHETITDYIWSTNAVGTWNREHVWPKSLSNGLWKDIKNNEGGGGGDLHHIRPSEKEMNSTRGNDKFGEVTNGGEVYSKTRDGKNSKLGGHHAGGVFEPLDDVKGDAARIVLYLYTHYNTYQNVYGTTNGNGQESYFGTLKFTDVMAADSEESAIGLLLAWNKLDPVDEIERTRNEEVFRIQGNRNPFIDHPEYAEKIWDPAAAPVDPEPVDPEPVEPEPDEPKPVDPEPEDPKPAEPAEHENGCGGLIGGAGAAVLIAAAAAVVAVRRRGQ